MGRVLTFISLSQKILENKYIFIISKGFQCPNPYTVFDEFLEWFFQYVLTIIFNNCTPKTGLKTYEMLALFEWQDTDNSSTVSHVIAGLSGALCARGTEPHTHRIWSTSFLLVGTWLTERTYVRVYSLYGWGRGDYQGRGVSGLSWQIHIFY